jgi:hypothetical protein
MPAVWGSFSVWCRFDVTLMLHPLDIVETAGNLHRFPARSEP